MRYGRYLSYQAPGDVTSSGSRTPAGRTHRSRLEVRHEDHKGVAASNHRIADEGAILEELRVLAIVVDTSLQRHGYVLLSLGERYVLSRFRHCFQNTQASIDAS
jgi:hypothetical protein